MIAKHFISASEDSQGHLIPSEATISGRLTDAGVISMEFGGQRSMAAVLMVLRAALKFAPETMRDVFAKRGFLPLEDNSPSADLSRVVLSIE